MKPILILLSFLALAVRIHADSVTVGDPSFEGNTLTAGGGGNNIGPEWTGTNGSNTGSAFEEYITGFASEGTDHLGMENNYDVWQDLGVTYQANTRYTLTVAAGNRSGVSQSGNLSQYYLADSTGTIYASGSYDAYANVLAGQFADAPALVFDTSNNPAAAGKTIRILLHSGGSGRSHFDNIRLQSESLVVPGAAILGALSSTAVGTTAQTQPAVLAYINDRTGFDLRVGLGYAMV